MGGNYPYAYIALKMPTGGWPDIVGVKVIIGSINLWDPHHTQWILNQLVKKAAVNNNKLYQFRWILQGTCRAYVGCLEINNVVLTFRASWISAYILMMFY